MFVCYSIIHQQQETHIPRESGITRVRIEFGTYVVDHRSELVDNVLNKYIYSQKTNIVYGVSIGATKVYISMKFLLSRIENALIVVLLSYSV
jgi:hypothetical protein